MNVPTAADTPLNGLDATAPASLLKGMADITVMLDAAGKVTDVAFGSADLRSDLGTTWIGSPWKASLHQDSLAQLQALLRESATQEVTRWHQLTHLNAQGDTVAVQYRARRFGNDGAIIAIGRDLQGMAALQQQLVDAQQALERDYWRFRQIETRYRLLFRMVSEAILIIDAPTQRVVEANPAACQLLGETSSRVIGRPFPEGFETEGTHAINGLLAGVRAAGRADDVRARRSETGREFVVSASMLRQEGAAFLLVRLTPVVAEANVSALPEAKLRAARIFESAPDCIVITDANGHILSANGTFLSLAELATEQQIRGESLDRWLGRPGVDLSVLIANLKQHTTVRLFATTLRGEYGSEIEVEISAAAVRGGDQTYFGFFIRDVGRRLGAAPTPTPDQNRWLDQLTERVGRVPLKELVRESTDTIERICIETALQLTGDNRASAAELLGLSRQSLYVKIDRYNIVADTSSGTDAPS